MGGIDHNGVKGKPSCCPALCGEFCGGDDCAQGPNGATDCCSSGMENECSSGLFGHNAPCLLPVIELDDTAALAKEAEDDDGDGDGDGELDGDGGGDGELGELHGHGEL